MLVAHRIAPSITSLPIHYDTAMWKAKPVATSMGTLPRRKTVYNEKGRVAARTVEE